MNDLARLDLEVMEIKQLVVSEDAAGETVVIMELVGGQMVDLHLPPQASAKLKGYLARASAVQAKAALVQ